MIGVRRKKLVLHNSNIYYKFVAMAYNRNNYFKRVRFIIEVYKQAKHADVPDTQIVRTVFPKHNIHLSYRQWMNLKGLQVPKAPVNQLDLFSA
jgi:hypothetical protein